jgi:hypothetical protein
VAELSIFLLKHFGLAAIILIFGYIADHVSSHSLKEDVARWLSAKRQLAFSRPILARVLRSFLEGYVQKIFATRPWSIKFFIRSSLVSASIFCIVVALQWTLYEGSASDQFSCFIINPIAGIGMLMTALFLNWIIDYAANAKTYCLLRMASESGRPFDFFLTIFADLGLTVTLFVAVFPATVSASLYIFQFFNTSVTVEVRPVDPFLKNTLTSASKEYVDQLAKLNGIAPTMHMFLVTNYKVGRHIAFATPISDSFNYLTMFTFDAADDAESVKRYSDLLDEISDGADVKIPFNEKADTPATIDVERSFDLASADALKIYSAASAQVNEDRRYILEMLALRTATIDFATAKIETDNWDANGGIVICADGSFKDVTSAETVKLKLPCGAKTLFSSLSLDQQQDLLDVRSLLGVEMPMTPFFVTSFSLSIMYYCVLLICLIGTLTISTLRRLFASELLDLSGKPFTIMSLVAFPFFLIVGYLVNWYIG